MGVDGEKQQITDTQEAAIQPANFPLHDEFAPDTCTPRDYVATALVDDDICQGHTYDYNQTYIAAKMLLELREGHQVSQVVIADVVENCRMLCNHSVQDLKNSITTVMDVSSNEDL